MVTSNNKYRFESSIFRAFSDPVRIEIISYIRDSEKCVCDLVAHLNLVQPVVSRHLKILKIAGLVKCRKDGIKHLYFVSDPRIFGLIDTLTPDLVNELSKNAFEGAFC